MLCFVLVSIVTVELSKVQVLLSGQDVQIVWYYDNNLCNSIMVGISWLYHVNSTDKIGVRLWCKLFLLSVVGQQSTTSNEQVFTNIFDTIVSPNYPKSYKNYEDRRYKIRAPMRSEILLIFNHFNLEGPGPDDCPFDYLEASTSIKEWI